MSTSRSRFLDPSDMPIKSVLRRNTTAPIRTVREPTRPGARCALSDLLESECACRIHKKTEILDGPTDAQEEELDFRNC